MKNNRIINKNKEIIFYPKKTFGQNFLFDKEEINKILSFINLEKKTIFFEIGTGYGSITKEIIKNSNCELIITIEKDIRIYKWLKNNIKKWKFYEKIILINEDAIKINWDFFLEKYKKENFNIVFIGNLPYNIANLLIKKIIDIKNINLINYLLFTIQKELAQKWAANNKNEYKKKYSNVSIYINYFFYTNLLKNISKNSFIPKPKVDGAIIKLEVKKKIEKNENIFFFKFINNCFKFRRKTLRKNLYFIDKSLIEKIFTELKIKDINIRPQNLSIENYEEIFKIITKNKKIN